MSGKKRDRFMVRSPSGEEVPVGSVSELEERVRAGDILPDQELYDAGTGVWAPASEVSLYRFIVEELERDDQLPDALREALSGVPGEATAADSRPNGEGETGAESVGAGAATVEGEGVDDPVDDPDHDPLDFQMELVDTHPLGPLGDPSDPGEGPLPAAAASEEDELEDFELRLGSSVEFDWGDVDPGAASTEEPGPSVPTADPPSGVEPGRKEGAAAGKPVADEEEPWFTPLEEGGMVLPDMEREPEGSDEKVEVWRPDREEAPTETRRPLIQKTPYRPRAWVVGLLLLVGGVAALLVLLPDEPGPGLDEEWLAAVPSPDPPPAPEGLGAESSQVLEVVETTFTAASDSIRGELGLEPVPPNTWLSGFYLANAGQFPEVAGFWEDYLEFLEVLRPRDETLFRFAVTEALDGFEHLDEGERDRLDAYFRVRYERQEEYRAARYEHLASVARAAIQLHDVLRTHQDEIAYSPAVGSGVSADPILEAVIPEGPVRRDVELALDRVFRALDRSRGGGVPSADGLRAELFLRFGEG